MKDTKKWRIQCYILVEKPEDDEIYIGYEKAMTAVDQLKTMQPENLYLIREVNPED